jgi:hypothetical protein
MAKKMIWAVRIVASPQEMDGEGSSLGNHTIGELLECLRYAGLVRIHRDNAEGVCFDLVSPAGVDSETWAQMNADRMSSFGWNAVKAPAMPGQLPR